MEYFFGRLIEGRFIKRDNRFRAEIQIAGETFKAHVANSGRMKELLIPGAKIWLQEAVNKERKTPYDLVLVEHGQGLVCLNAHLANTVFYSWLKKGILQEFNGFIDIKKEKKVGKSRIDFQIEYQDYSRLVEIKSVNLVCNNTAMFPDAPTLRGVKHLEELIQQNNGQQKSEVVFIVLREDACRFSPNGATDPAFAAKLKEVINKGIGVYVYKCRISPEGIAFAGEIPISI